MTYIGQGHFSTMNLNMKEPFYYWRIMRLSTYELMEMCLRLRAKNKRGSLKHALVAYICGDR